jgi:eukaryotic-like serine/threonine-protein kinase
MSGVAQYAVSQSGSLVYVPRDETRLDRRLFEVDLEGKARALGHEPRAFQEISVCGDRLAVSIVGRAGFDVWIGRVAGGALTQLTHTGSAMDPAWRPGCVELAYSSGNELYLHRADGSAPPVRLQQTTLVQGPTSWSPDGTRLVYVEVSPETRFDLWALTVADQKRQLLVTSPAVDANGRVSPVGQWLAYQSMEPQRYEVFVRPLSATGGRVQVSPAGGSEPAWSPDGRTLYYLYDRTVFSVEFDAATGTPKSMPKQLFHRAELSAYTVLPNGNFLVADRIREHMPITTLNLVVNWANEVAR